MFYNKNKKLNINKTKLLNYNDIIIMYKNAGQYISS